LAATSGSSEWALVNADPRLNKILLNVCEETLNARTRNTGQFRVTVENTIARLLPHGQAHAHVVAAKLGMSERTLTRRLAEEDVTFIEVLRQLKASLASRYLEDEGMPISKIAWLLGFEDASSFSHAPRVKAFRKRSGVARAVVRRRSVAFQHYRNVAHLALRHSGNVRKLR
jgi:AraC-like DNA-binding protein